MRISDWSSDVCSSDLPTKEAVWTQQDQTASVTLPRTGRSCGSGGTHIMGSVTDEEHGNTSTNRGRIVRKRSEEHTSELQSLMRISYAVFCLKKKNKERNKHKQ